MGIVPAIAPTTVRIHRRKPKHQASSKPSTDPTVHLHIGTSSPPIYMTARQSLLTSASKALHRHLRAQVPNPREYACRDKTMKMRNESPATVARFLGFLETGGYQLRGHGDQTDADAHADVDVDVDADADADADAAAAAAVRTHLRMFVFAAKYEIPRLAAYARRRAGAVLEGMVAAAVLDGMDAMSLEDAGTADTRAEEESSAANSEKVCSRVFGAVLKHVSDTGERKVLRDVLGRLVVPYVWKASGEW